MKARSFECRRPPNLITLQQLPSQIIVGEVRRGILEVWAHVSGNWHCPVFQQALPQLRVARLSIVYTGVDLPRRQSRPSPQPDQAKSVPVNLKLWNAYLMLE
jgi:hypothetical protein